MELRSVLFLLLIGIVHVSSVAINKSKGDGKLNFIVMGDWGGLPVVPYYTPFEKATATAMAEAVKTHNSQYVFALGDNFYYNGVTDEHDPRFKTTFENIFHQQSLLDIDWYLVAGNHDHNGNVTGQIAYSSHSSRWKFPDLWYQLDFKYPTFNISIIMIDTVVLCGNTGKFGELEQPEGPEDALLANKELMYIEEALINAAKSKYVLVMGHFPVLSVAEHGPTKCLQELLDPLLVKHKVSAYFCGHDHNLQHLKDPKSGMNYFVSGAVDVVDPSMKHAQSVPTGSLLYHFGDIFGLGGFATVSVNETALVVDFHDATNPGKSLYMYEIPPRY